MEESCRDLTSLFISSPSTFSTFDSAVQDHLTRNDEIMALVDSARLEIQHTTDVAFAALFVQTKELLSLYAVIDVAEAAVDRAHDAAQRAFDRYELLYGSVEGNTGKGGVSGGLALMASLFTRGSSSTAGSGTGRADPDTPVKLLPYVPLTLNPNGELKSLFKAVNGGET